MGVVLPSQAGPSGKFKPELKGPVENNEEWGLGGDGHKEGIRSVDLADRVREGRSLVRRRASCGHL